MKWMGRRGTTEHPGLTAATSGQCDPYIDGHAERVEEYTRLILETLRVRGQQAEQIVTAARLHEIGKTEQALASAAHIPRLMDSVLPSVVQVPA